MPIPAQLVDRILLRQPASRRPRRVFAPYLSLTIISGLLGVLGDMDGGMLARMGGPLAFSLSLALWSASQFADLAARPGPAGGDATPRSHVQAVSRQIYVLLYALFAAREIQYALAAPAGGLTNAQAMHGLWPYLLGALPSLILVRVLSSRGTFSSTQLGVG